MEKLNITFKSGEENWSFVTRGQTGKFDIAHEQVRKMSIILKTITLKNDLVI